MIDTGKPFNIDDLKATMPWKPVVYRNGVMKMIDRNNKEVDIGDMVNFVEYSTGRIASAAQK